MLLSHCRWCRLSDMWRPLMYTTTLSPPSELLTTYSWRAKLKAHLTSKCNVWKYLFYAFWHSTEASVRKVQPNNKIMSNDSISWIIPIIVSPIDHPLQLYEQLWWSSNFLYPCTYGETPWFTLAADSFSAMLTCCHLLPANRREPISIAWGEPFCTPETSVHYLPVLLW